MRAPRLWRPFQNLMASADNWSISLLRYVKWVIFPYQIFTLIPNQTNLWFIYRSCYAPKEISSETRRNLKDDIGFQDGVSLHFDQMAWYAAEETCYSQGDRRYWSQHRVNNFGRVEDPEYKLVRTGSLVQLQSETFNDVIDEKEFCLYEKGESLVVNSCRQVLF